jgi:hypothetical protein
MMGACLESLPPIALLPATGESLRRSRLRANLSLDEVGQRFRNRVTRQRVSKIEKNLVVSGETAAAYRAAVKLAKAEIAAARRRLEAITMHGRGVRDFENRKLNHAR